MQWCRTNNHARERARRQSGPPTALTLPDRALTWNGRALFSWRIDRRATRLDEQFVPRASRSGWLCVSRVRFLAASAARRTRWRASAVSPCFEITSGILLDAPRRELPSGARRALSARTRSRNPENPVPSRSFPRRLTRVLSTQVLVLTVWSWLSVESFRLSGARRASSSGSRVGDEELTSATRSSHIVRRATNGWWQFGNSRRSSASASVWSCSPVGRAHVHGATSHDAWTPRSSNCASGVRIANRKRGWRAARRRDARLLCCVSRAPTSGGSVEL